MKYHIAMDADFHYDNERISEYYKKVHLIYFIIFYSVIKSYLIKRLDCIYSNIKFKIVKSMYIYKLSKPVLTLHKFIKPVQ